MFCKPNASSPAPLYVQVMDQVRHAVEVGVLQPGEQLPGIRHLAGTLALNVNTVAKAYRELEHIGILELRQGTGAFITGANPGGARVQAAAPLVTGLVERLRATGLSESQIRRLFESALLHQEKLARVK